MKTIFRIIIISTGLLLGQTGEQINQAKQVVQRTGMTKNQVKDAAKARGYTDKQIDAVIQKDKGLETVSDPGSVDSAKIPKLGKSNEVVQGKPISEKEESLIRVEEQPSLDTIKEELPIIGGDDLEIVDQKDLEFQAQPAKRALSYFGYDIFAKDPALFQAASVGVVDPDYLIGPGDEIIVMLWGETQFRQVLTVDREGFVFIPEIGQVFVNGLNLNLLESKLFRVFSQSYASLNPQGRTPTTFLDVSLGNLRPLRIQVMGEVAQPGAYTVSPSATLFSALYYFNGPTTLGSLRDIQLIRGGEKIGSIDFYDYLLTGKKPKDLKLQLDDVIFIPRRLKTVSVEGEINRNGIYELKAKENLSDLITIAGDLNIKAYLNRAQIDRIVPFEDRTELGMDRIYTDVNLGELINSEESFPLQDGDRIQVFSILDLRQNVVELQGAVTRPGNYDLGESLKLSELIDKADGLLGDAYMERVDIVRIKSDFTEELIRLDLGQAINGDLNNNINLQGLDRVRVYGMREMVPKTYVSITGHVKFPGKFLLQKNMTLYDLIFMAGRGYVDDQYKKLTYLKRAELIRTRKDSDVKEIISFNLGQVLNEDGMANTLLRAEDEVRIYSVIDIVGTEDYVSIGGHVKRPGRYELFEDNMRMYDLLFKAGGFDDPLYRSKTFMSRADLVRFDQDRVTQSIIPLNIDEILSDKNSKQNIKLLPGDEVRVYSEAVFNAVKPVSIKGVVRNPGKYNLKTNMVLKDLILEAGGLNENIFRYKVEVARIDPFNNSLDEYAEVMIFNIDEKFRLSFINSDNVLKKESLARTSTFQLEPYDLITIRPDPYFNNQKEVIISGAVLYPGAYTILNSKERLTDIIKRAGGLRKNAYPYGSRFTRLGQIVQVDFKKIIKNERSRLNIELQDGDEIQIAIKPKIIELRGQVNAPGFFKYQPGKRINDVINMAGGYTQEAEKNNIYIEYPNGISKKYNRWFRNSKVKDGSIVTVGKKKEVEPFDVTEYAKELSSVIANLAQTISLIALAYNR